MTTQIEHDATLILRALAAAPRDHYVEGPKLAEKTGLDAGRVNDSVAFLVEAGYAKWSQVMGTAPFDFGDAIITHRGRHQVQRLNRDLGSPSIEPLSGAWPAKPTSIRLFISHSSDDRQLASELVGLFRAALNLPASAIRCSSVDGYRLPGGANTDEQLRREVHEAEAFLGIVSTASLRSLYVLFELGARWGANRPMIPLLAPGTPTSVLGGPLAGLSALDASSASQLHQLLSEVAGTLSLELESPASFHEQLQSVARFKSAPSEAVEQAAKTGETDRRVPKEAESILSALASNPEGVMAEDLASEANLSELKAQYFLDMLTSEALVEESTYSGRPSDYFLSPRGRKYLFERGMVE